MIWIEHRRNKCSDLKSVDPSAGVEIDVRTNGGKLILAHDPFESGDELQDWLAEYKRLGAGGPILFNTKEDGLEEILMETMKRENLTNYLFLDTSVPTLVRFSKTKHFSKFMQRLSAYEGYDDLIVAKGEKNWLWVDCFDGKPLPVSLVKKAARKFKICLVSPELQKKNLNSAKQFIPLAKLADAVCTKDVRFWSTLAEKIK